MQYTYYALSSLQIRVPKYMKEVLTTLQITQIVVGCTYALAHLFVAYDIPVQSPYRMVGNLASALPSSASTLSSALSGAVASATASVGISNWLKKAALRAAGEEGLAENVRNNQGETFGIDAIHAANVEESQTEIKYRMGTQQVHCLDTSGEAFAILINAIYLIPLFVFFVKFYRQSYITRAKAEPPKPTEFENIKQSSKDAIKGVEQEIKEAMANEQGGPTEPPPELQAKLEKAKSDAKKEATELEEKAHNEARDLTAKANEGTNYLKTKAKNATGDLPSKAQEGAKDLTNQVKNIGEKVSETITNGIKHGAEKSHDVASDIPSKAKDMGEQAKKVGSEGEQGLQENKQALQEKLNNEDAEKPSSSGKENGKPNGDTVNRNRSPEKASKPRNPSPEKKASVPRQKSPEKKSSRSRLPGPEKKDTVPREKSPEKKVPVSRDAEPQSSSPKQDNEPEKKAEDDKKEASDLGASGYEVVPDEPKTKEERKAEEEFLPKPE